MGLQQRSSGLPSHSDPLRQGSPSLRCASCFVDVFLDWAKHAAFWLVVVTFPWVIFFFQFFLPPCFSCFQPWFGPTLFSTLAAFHASFCSGYFSEWMLILGLPFLPPRLSSLSIFTCQEELGVRVTENCPWGQKRSSHGAWAPLSSELGGSLCFEQVDCLSLHLYWLEFKRDNFIFL